MIVLEEIEKCEDNLLQAMRTSDIDMLNKLISDKLIFNIPNGDVISKEIDLESYRSGDMIIERIDCIDRQIQEFGDTAIVSTKVRMKGSFIQQPFDGEVRSLRTWKKILEKWMIIGGASINVL